MRLNVLAAMCLAVPAVTVPLVSNATTAPAPLANWIGTWVLDVSASDFGMSPAPDSAHTVIVRADDRLELTRKVWTSMAGHRDVEFDQATDGEPGEASATDGETIPSRVWWEGDDLVIEVEVESNMGAIVVTDHFSLVDEDQLVIERVMDVPSVGEVTQTLVHRRRE